LREKTFANGQNPKFEFSLHPLLFQKIGIS